MAGVSDYVENIFLNWLRGTAAPTAPATTYVGLFSSDPTDAASGGTEVTTTIRTAGRVAVAFATASTVGAIANTSIVDFGNAAAGATLSHFAGFDAASGGNKLWSTALSPAKTINTGDPVNFAVGALQITLD